MKKPQRVIFVAFIDSRVPRRADLQPGDQMLAKNDAQLTVDVSVITPSPLAL